MQTDLIILFGFMFVIIVTHHSFFVNGQRDCDGDYGDDDYDTYHSLTHDVIIDPRWENNAFETFYRNVFCSDLHTYEIPPTDMLKWCVRKYQDKCILEENPDAIDTDQDVLRDAIYIHNEHHYPNLPHKPRQKGDFPGKYILISGESPDPTQNRPEEIMNRTIFIGHHISTRAKHTFWISWSSFIFNFLQTRSPLELFIPRVAESSESNHPSGTIGAQSRRKFAAYFASNCVPYREKIYDDLVEFARKHDLGTVSAFGPCCGSHPETRDNRLARSVPDMYTKNIELQSEFRFVLALENAHKDYYIDQKITIAFLAGAIPIYSGSKNVFDIFNKDAFSWMEPYQSIVDILSPIVLDKWKYPVPLSSNFRTEREHVMLKAPILTRQGMYHFSWHLDVHNLLKRLDRTRPTLREALWDVVKGTGVQPPLAPLD